MTDTYNVKKSECTRLEYNLFFPSDTNLCLSKNVNDIYMPVCENFNKNVVDNFRSVDFATYQAGYLLDNIGGPANTPAIPIKKERVI
jgi:hypothetical protein